MRDRLIATAVDAIAREGMTVSLEHVSLERVIAESGISRATAYRHFASKADFLTEVLTAVVRATRLDGALPAESADLLSLVTRRQQALGSAQGRRDLVVEALRRACDADFAWIASSPQWRTYLALHATCRGLPEGTLRNEVRAVLADTEERFTAHRSTVYAHLATAIGYRLVPPLQPPSGFRVLAEAAGALMTGLVVRSWTGEEGAAGTEEAAAFGSTETVGWSRPARHLTGLVLAHLEPDPDVVWDERRVAATVASVQEVFRAAAGM